MKCGTQQATWAYGIVALAKALVVTTDYLLGMYEQDAGEDAETH
jgi:hypothetical protein